MNTLNLSLLTWLIFLAETLSAQQGANGVQSMSGLIRESDTMSIQVFREPELNTAGQLGSDGSLTMPLIGTIRLQGLTTTQAEGVIEQKLRDGYLVRPQVSVRITQRVIRTVTVSGEVRQPGVFTLPYDRKLSLVQVVNMAGGPSDIANIKKVSLRSGSTGKVSLVNMKSILRGKAKDIILKKGDVIHIPEGFF